MKNIHVMTAFLMACLIALSCDAYAEQALDVTEVNLPVLIQNERGGSGTGFYVSSGKGVFLVTAKHVFFGIDGKTKKIALIAKRARLTSYSINTREKTPFIVSLDLESLNNSGNIKYDADHDVAVIRMELPGGRGIAGVSNESRPKSRIILSRLNDMNIRYAQVQVSNDVFIIGYPVSLGLEGYQQIDPARPLLRKGVVSGKNDLRKAIIIDCPSYPGNSGGPVIMIENQRNIIKYKIIGIVVELVPLVEKWTSNLYAYQNQNWFNSGYTMVEPVDSVLDIIARFE